MLCGPVPQQPVEAAQQRAGEFLRLDRVLRIVEQPGVEVHQPDDALLRGGAGLVLVAQRPLPRLAGCPQLAHKALLALLLRGEGPALPDALHLVAHHLLVHGGLLGQTHRVDLALHRAGQLGDDAGGLLEIGHLLHRVAQISPLRGGGEAVFHVVCRALEQRAEGLAALRPDELVGILRALHLQNPHLEIQLFEDADGPLAGLLARAVVVVGNDDFAGVARDQPRLLRREGRAEARHGAVKARLVQADHVYIALREQNISAFALFCQV